MSADVTGVTTPSLGSRRRTHSRSGKTLVRYVIGRVTQGLMTLGVLLPSVFLLFRLAPGDAADAVVGPDVDPVIAESLRRKYGLDQPIFVQFALWMKGLIHGDLGTSFQYQRPVRDVLVDRLVNTLALVIPACTLAITVAIVVGAVAGASRGWKDRAITNACYAIKSSPSFWVGTMAVLLFSYKLGWFPSIGMGGGAGVEQGSNLSRFLTLDYLHHLAMPMVILACYVMVEPLLTTRSGVKEIMTSDFMALAAAQGSSVQRAVRTHGIKNALLPVISLSPLLIESMIGGQIIIETVFSWPGMGRAIVVAVDNADYPMMQAVFLLTAIAVIVTNTLVDIGYAYIDPRVRLT